VQWPSHRLQPHSYGAFRCIGADCEDTCCVGWAVNVDRSTYEAYQSCEDLELGASLHQLVTINQPIAGNAANSNDDNYARITLSGAACPFLSEGLCSIQKKLGEQYLSKMCAAYPRVMSLVDDVLYRSLHLSCPEAARIMLLDPHPMQFDAEEQQQDESHRLGNLAALDTSSARYTDKPYRYFREVRSLVIWILQNRDYALWQRLAILGSLCDQLHQASSAGRHQETPQVLEGYRDAVTRGLFDESLGQLRAQPAMQLETVVELIVGRIGSDYTSPRFLECYKQFMLGLEWTAQSTMEDIGSRYATVYSEYYTPFMAQHEYMLEHYLVNYVHSSLFPFGPQESTQNLGAPQVVNSISKRYMLMAAYYVIIKTVLIGMAGVHRKEFSREHVIKLVQSCAKTFEHSVAFPARAFEILRNHGIENCVSMALVIQN
jgi:lysine-N-methylase